jgi:hypothetical protein
MQKIRAKFLVHKAEKNDHGGQYVEATPVTTGEGDNADFAKATPSGSLSLYIDNPDAVDFFKEGDEVYLTFQKEKDPNEGKGDEEEQEDNNGGMVAKKTVHGAREVLRGGIIAHEGITSAPPPNSLSAEMAAKGGSPAVGNAAHPDNMKAFEERGEAIDPSEPRKPIDPKDVPKVGGVIPDAVPEEQTPPVPAGGNLESEPSTDPKPPASGGTNTAADDAPEKQYSVPWGTGDNAGANTAAEDAPEKQ